MNPMVPSLRRAAGVAVLAAGATGLFFAAGCASAPATAPAVRLDFPSPTSGPGQPDLDAATTQELDQGWQALLGGNAAAARVNAARGTPNPATELLALQAAIVAEDDDPVPGLERLTAAESGYAAAWLTLSVAAEKAGNQQTALFAASRGAELWPDTRWIERNQDLYQRWVGSRIESSRELNETGNSEAALDALQPALAVAPGDRDAVLMQARILISLDQPDRAEAALAGLPRDPEVIRLAGNIAEARGDLNAALRIYSSLPDDSEAVLSAAAIAEKKGDWLSAMNLYTTLPEETPEKDPGLRRAKLRWRISVMPEYVQEAFNSRHLDRAQLAVIVISGVPRVETMATGQVPLLSDVMTLPSQEEILTAARLGLIESDQFLHRFHPHRTATGDEVKHAIENLGLLLGVDSPRWCTEDLEDRPCAEIVEPVSGETVAGIVIEMAVRKGEGE
jgi:tetratricopeptide (TPR) repeat protein